MENISAGKRECGPSLTKDHTLLEVNSTSSIAHQPSLCQAPTGKKSPEEKNEPVSSDSLPPKETVTIDPASLPFIQPHLQSMAHHNASSKEFNTIYYKRDIEIEKRYGVPQAYRILTMGNYHKYHDDINNMLRVVFGLESKERSAIFCLVRLFLYYGKVYAKAADVAEQEDISKRTFWRAINKLRGAGIEVLNRYVNHKQISNMYRLDKLIVMIARFIAEHREVIFGDFGNKITSFFRSFWDVIWDVDINLSLAAPIKLELQRLKEFVPTAHHP